MTFTTSAAAVETAKASLAAANAALLAASDAEHFTAAGMRRPGHVATANGAYTVSTDAAGAAHVVETLPA